MKNIVVNIPRNLNINGVYRMIDKIIWKGKQNRPKSVEFSFLNLEFVEPVGLCALYNLISLFNSLDIDVYFSYYDDVNNQSILYLDDSGFFSSQLGKPLRTSARIRDTTFPLIKVRHSDSFYWMDNNFIPWLSGRLNAEKEELGSIKTCLSEMFNNIRDHSGRNIGCVFAQHYPQKRSGEIRISVSDFGHGIPETIRKIDPDLEDHEAILYATTEGVSSKSIPNNRGAGFGILIDNVVSRNLGSLTVYSGRGIVRCRPKNGRTRRKAEEAPGTYPGTLIELVLDVSTFQPDEYTREDLEW